MRLLSLLVMRSPPSADIQPLVLCSAFDLSSLSFFQRSSAKEFAVFLARTVGARTTVGTRQRVPEGEYVCYAFAKRNGLIGVAIGDGEYPQRVAFAIVNNMLDEFERSVNRVVWTTSQRDNDNTTQLPALEQWIKEYQDPAKADKITAIQRDLDETKVVMSQNIDAILARGEKLDLLVEKSADLSASSKTFYKTAKKHNQCCVVM
eukprot:ANDGO_02929.mRNA.1 VAMP-like protein YKT61